MKDGSQNTKMSPDMRTPKPPTIFVPAICKEITFSSGHSIIRVSVNVKAITAFLEANRGESDWCNMELVKRKETGKHGETHFLRLSNWKPENEKPKQEEQEKPVYKKANSVDVPF